MEFEGAELDSSTLRGLVRTMSGSLDRLTERGGSTDEPRRRSASDEEQETPECRVCRGESEPGRRLHAPCLCSGSIMHTHEDCLLEWLRHSGKDSCELCGALFKFTPVYDPDAPRFLSVWQVLATCVKKVILKWLPMLLRVMMVTALWLVFVPVCTSWLYRIWIHRSRVLLPQLFVQRLTATSIWSDCISGIIITAAIILSFLSLMTFADFLAEQLLRDDWAGPIGFEHLNGMHLVEAMAEAMDDMNNDNPNNDQNRGDRAEVHGGQDVNPRGRRAGDGGAGGDGVAGNAAEELANNDVQIGVGDVREGGEQHGGGRPGAAQPVRAGAGAGAGAGGFEGEMEVRGRRAGGGRGVEVAPDRDGGGPGLHEAVQHGARREGGDRVNGFGVRGVVVAPRVRGGEGIRPLGPMVAEAAAEEENEDLDEAMLEGDMEVHMAIDELLGLHGPVTMLLRNVMWLLAFHGAYLGLFAFFPFSIGASVVHAVSHYMDPPASLGQRSEYVALRGIVKDWYLMATSSEDNEDTLRLPDLTTICLGYLVMSTMVFMWRGIINAVSERADTQLLRQTRKAMRVTAAVVKVGLLLSLKMLLLPLLLGVCLDGMTLDVFGCTGEQRARFMGQHLVGSLLLHWVLGITFMLFVTVSVLQLREVVHPDLLSLIIRPQEPHPDLLGSLLQESGRTHARRMAISLMIYLALVAMFVWVPTKLVKCLLPSAMPIKLQLRYGMPQLQIPAELVVLHLAMLAFLEKYQNRIGEMQHAWLVVACGKLGLTRYVLPQPIIGRQPPKARVQEEADTTGGGLARRVLVAVKVWWDGGEEGRDDEDGIVVGPPLPRPPPGWDDPAGVAQGRWAWGMEPPGEVQRNLAPRRRHGARAVPLLALLVGLAWVTILAVVLSIVLLPFLLGRAVFMLLHLPRRWTHDTASFSVGLAVLKVITPLLYRACCVVAREVLRVRRRAGGVDSPGAQARRVPTRGEALPAPDIPAVVAAAEARDGRVGQLRAHRAGPGVELQGGLVQPEMLGERRRNPPREEERGTALPARRETREARDVRDVRMKLRFARKVTMVTCGVLWLFVAPYLAAGLFEVTFVVLEKDWERDGLRALPGWGQPLRTLLLGWFLLHTWAYLCFVGTPRWVTAVARAVGLQQPRADAAGVRRRNVGHPWPPCWRDRMEVSPRVLIKQFSRAVVVRLLTMIVVPAFFSMCTCLGLSAGSSLRRNGCFVQLLEFRIALFVLILLRASACMVAPAAVWLKALHDSVRDDRYLVGMRLEDHKGKR